MGYNDSMLARGSAMRALRSCPFPRQSARERHIHTPALAC